MGIFAKIKAAWAARKVLNEATKGVTMDGQTKPGWQTSEFWTKNVVQVIVIYNALAKKDISPELAVQLVVALEGAYTVGRSLVKTLKDFAGAFKKKDVPA